MHHPRFSANGGGYNNINLNQRNVNNPHIPPDTLSALSRSRQAMPEAAALAHHQSNVYRHQAGMFPPGVASSSRAMPQQPDMSNPFLMSGGVLTQPPLGIPLHSPPHLWNPALESSRHRHSHSHSAIPANMVPSQQHVWERAVRAPAPSQLPQTRQQQEQPLDLTKKVAPVQPVVPPPPVAPSPQIVDMEAPLDFSTKPRNRTPASTSSSSAPVPPIINRTLPERASFPIQSNLLMTFDQSAVGVAHSHPKSQAIKEPGYFPQRHNLPPQPKPQSLLHKPPPPLPQSSTFGPVVPIPNSNNNNNNASSSNIRVPVIDQPVLESPPVPTNFSSNRPPVPTQLTQKEEIVEPSPTISVIHPNKPPVPCHSETSPAPLLPAVTAPFPWYTYTTESRCQVVPEEAFQHISDMLSPIVQVNTVFDFVYNRNTLYWPCLVCAVSRTTMQIRYIGAEPGFKKPGGRIWVEAGDERMKPRGWGQKHRLSMKLPPEFEPVPGVTPKDVVQMTLDLQPLSNVLIQHSATCCADLFAPGRLLELQDLCDPRVFWFARVIRNHCGRLCLQYVTAPEHDNAPALAASPHLRAFNPQPAPVWLFASSRRLRPVGWARDNDCIYKAPAGVRIVGSPFVISRSVLECTQLRVNQLAFQARSLQAPVKHSYSSGDKIDWLHPSRQFFCSATVRRIVDSEHFVISSFNGSDQSTGYVTTLADGECFPAGFATENNLAYRNESGILSQTVLNNNTSEKETNSQNNSVESAPFFAVGLKMEVAVPNAPELITIGTVVKVVQNAVVVVEVDANKSIYLFPVSSPDLLPIGFAEMSKHPMTLVPPLQQRKKQIAVVQPEIVGQSSNMAKNEDQNLARRPFNVISSPPHDPPASSPSEQATLLFSAKCFCGKLFSKSKVALLPPKIGPADVLVVLKEALSYLLNTAYRPSQVLKILHVKTSKFCRHNGFSAQQLKTRSGGKMYKATTVLCTNRANLPGYLRKIAHILGYCPALLYGTFSTDDPKQIERPPCTSMCRKTSAKPVTTRRAAAAAAATATRPTSADRRSPGKMLTVAVPSPHGMLAPDGRRSGHQGQHDSSGGPSSAASDSRSPRSTSPTTMEQLVGNLPLSTNPLRWSVDDVTRFMQFHECGEVAQSLADQEIDGPSLLLLTLAVIQDYLQLRMGPTLKLCRLLERLHIAFRQQLDLARDYFLTSSSVLIMPPDADLFGMRNDDEMDGINDNNNDNNNNNDGLNHDIGANNNGMDV